MSDAGLRHIQRFAGLQAFFDPGGALINWVVAGAARWLLNRLRPQISIPATLQQSQVYNVAAQQNLARMNAPMPVLYGTFRIYPDLLSQPWLEYDAKNDQYLYQLMAITQGQAAMLDLNIGDSPVSSFAGISYQLYQPGETVDLFHNNVATNDQVQDLTLVSVGSGTSPAQLTYDAAGHTITAGSGIFTAFEPLDRFEITGSLHNNGQYIVGSVSGDFKQLVVTGSLVNESPIRPTPTLATITHGVTTYGPTQLNFLRTALLGVYENRITSATGVSLATLSPGDSIAVTNSVLNDGTYTVTMVDAGGGYVKVTESVVTETASAPPPVLSQALLISKNVGPFYANPAQSNIDRFSVDIVFPKGFYNSDDQGNLTGSSATVRVEWRVQGDTAYTLAGDEVFSAAKNEPQRYTRTYTLPPGTLGRIEVKVTRLTETANSNRQVNESHWAGLRGFILPPATLPAGYDGPTFVTNEHYAYPDRTVLAIKVRATGQLSEAMTKAFNGIFQRLIPVWDGSAWTAPQPTSSIAWAFADAVTNTGYGLGRPASEVDVTSLAALDATWTLRGDAFNGYFDQSGTMFDSLAQIARCGRAQPSFDGRVFSMIRDEPRTLRSALFTDQNVAPASMAVNFDLIGEDSPLGVVVTYWDPDTYAQKTVLCGQDINAMQVTLTGCNSRQQAWNEGNFIVKQNLYRRVNVSFGTEMDGFLPTLGDLVTVQTQYMSWGQSARVLAVAGLTLTLDQRPDWSGTGFMVRLRNADGTPSDPISCSRGATDDQLVLASLPPFAILTGADQERTYVALGNSVSTPMDVLVKSVEPSDEFHAKVNTILDDPRVHADPGRAPDEVGGPASGALTYDGTVYYDGSQTYDGVR